MTCPPILIIEDDRAIRSLLVTMLRRHGLTATTAEDGAAGMECVERGNYKVVLLDAMMPRMNGYEFLALMKMRAAAERPIIFLLTGNDSPRNYDLDLVAATIRKPFDVELLTRMVADCVNAEEPHVA